MDKITNRFGDELTDTEYIGDGVYTGWAYGMLWITCDTAEGIQSIALEPEVFDSFVKYVERMRAQQNV